MSQVIIIGIVLFFAGAVKAQVAVNVNIGSPPPWGPAGYTEMRYYYLPDVESFYDIQSSRFIYRVGGIWVHKTYLPRQYRSYDLYGGYKVVMTDYRGNTPYIYFPEYKIKYAKGYHLGQAQKTFNEKPGQGNSGAKMYSNDHSNKKVSKISGKSVSNNNDMKMKKDRGHGEGKGKKK